MSNKVKDVSIKNTTYYFFNDIINIRTFLPQQNLINFLAPPPTSSHTQTHTAHTHTHTHPPTHTHTHTPKKEIT